VNRSSLTLYAFLVVACPAGAMDFEEIGTMQTTFDGESISQPTVLATTDDEKQATAYLFRPGGGFSALTLSSFGTGKPRVFLELSYSVETPARDTAPIFLAVTYAPTTGTQQHWTSEEALTPPTISFSTLDVDSAEGRAVGTFTALLCFAEDYGADADIGNCRTIEGSFDTRFFVEK